MTDNKLKVLNYDGRECMLIIHINGKEYVSKDHIMMIDGKFSKVDLNNMIFEELC